MAFLRSVFGPSKDEIWSQIASDLGGDYQDGGFFGKDVLTYTHGDWQFTLDTYTRSSGSGQNRSSTTYTRMRAPFVNKDGLYFKIYRASIFSPLGSLLGMQDIEIGDILFDKDFVIKGNREETIREFLADRDLKALIQQQPRIMMEIRDDEGWFREKFPDGVDELYFQCTGVIKDKARLKALFALFATALNRLVEIDSAYESDPGVNLE